jgi:hypothetical protein
LAAIILLGGGRYPSVSATTTAQVDSVCERHIVSGLLQRERHIVSGYIAIKIGVLFDHASLSRNKIEMEDFEEMTSHGKHVSWIPSSSYVFFCRRLLSQMRRRH